MLSVSASSSAYGTVRAPVLSAPKPEAPSQASDAPSQASEAPSQATESSPQAEVDIVINNVVCSFSVRCHLNLRDIALRGVNVEYRRENGVISEIAVLILALQLLRTSIT